MWACLEKSCIEYEYITREMSVVFTKSTYDISIKHYKVKAFVKKINKHGFTFYNKIYNMHLENRVNLHFIPTLKVKCITSLSLTIEKNKHFQTGSIHSLHQMEHCFDSTFVLQFSGESAYK